MADTTDNSATGGLLVVLGIIIALVVGYFLYKQGTFGHTGPSINVEMPSTPATGTRP
jgi:hypothetical protein